MNTKKQNKKKPKFSGEIPFSINQTYLIRSGVGLNPNTPQKCAGTRMDPPRSLPMPRRDPPAPIKAASPLEEPPGPYP